jgi:PAS domain S-box-containing protein
MDSHGTTDGQYRQRAYDIVEDEGMSYEEKQKRLVGLGREYLGVKNGHVEKYIEGGVHEVVVSDNREDVVVEAGDRVDRKFTFCRLTTERDTSLAISDAEEEGYGDDPAREEHGVSCYLGAKITVGNDLYGTVCFVDSEPRTESFTPEERTFVELIARLLGYQLESRGYEEEIDRREEELRLKNRAMDEAPVGITIADADGGEMPLVYVNDEFLEITGYARQDAVGRNCRFLQGEATEEDPIRRLAEAIDDEEAVTEEILNYRSDGTPFWNELTVSPVKDEDGEVSHYVGFQRDVTRRVRTRRLLSVISRALRHNVRNRLTAIRGLVDSVSRGEGQVAEYVEGINEGLDSIEEITEKTRRLEREVQNPPEPRMIDVSEEVREAVASLRERYPESSVGFDAPEGVEAVGSDRIREAFAELGENGVRHGGENVRFEVERGDDEVVVRVTDDGEGLPEVEKDVIRSGEETQLHHGSGVGLFLVNWLVTSVGGYLVTADSSDATVSVHLPASDDDDGKPGEGSVKPLGVGFGTER